MEENIVKGLFNIDSIKEASRGNVKPIEVSQISDNKLNDLYSQDDIETLMLNIEEFQLSQPLVVRKNNAEGYTLISGHRRLKACKMMFDKGKPLFYFNKIFINEVPCLIIENSFTNDDDEFLAIVSSNASRIVTADERKKIYLKLRDIYKRKCEAGKKPAGRERETIASWMGVTDRTISNYKKELLEVQKQNNLGKLIKKFNNFERSFYNFNLKDYSEDEIKKIKENAIPAINSVLAALNIDESELWQRGNFPRCKINKYFYKQDKEFCNMKRITKLVENKWASLTFTINKDLFIINTIC